MVMAPPRNSQPRARADSVLAGILFSAAVVFAVCVHLTSAIWPEDDAFITYRYVRNLVAGHGLVYNPGQRVLGTTTPLYTLWLVLLQVLFPRADLPTMAIRTNAIWYVAATTLTTRMVARLTGRPRLALILGSAAAVHPQMLDISLGGMEPYLFGTLVIGALLTLSGQRMMLSGVLAGLSLVARPEGLFVCAGWGIVWLWRRNLGDWRPLVAALAPPLAWSVFALSYYGTVVPHSITAKNVPLYIVPFGENLARLIIQLVTWFGGHLFGTPALAIGLTVCFLLSGLVALPRRLHHGWLPLLAFFGPFILYARPHLLLFSWYYPILYLLWLAIIAAASTLVPSRLAACLAVFLVALAPSVTWAENLAAGTAPPYTYPVRTRIVAYRQAAEWLNACAMSGTTVLAPEIGAFGYYGHFRVLDGCGLVSPEALPFLPAPSSGAIPLGMVAATQPEYIVTLPYFDHLAAEGLIGAYVVEQTIPLPERISGWDSSAVVIYRSAHVPRCTPATGRAPLQLPPALQVDYAVVHRLRGTGVVR